MERRIPQKARSPLQPFLALYGLTFSSLLRTDPTLSSSVDDQLFSRASKFSRGEMQFGSGLVVRGAIIFRPGLRSC
jgi:hypothetical protein